MTSKVHNSKRRLLDIGPLGLGRLLGRLLGVGVLTAVLPLVAYGQAAPTADQVKKALDARREELKSTLDKAGEIEQDVARLAEERGKIAKHGAGFGGGGHGDAVLPHLHGALDEDVEEAGAITLVQDRLAGGKAANGMILQRGEDVGHDIRHLVAVAGNGKAFFQR